MKFTKGFKKDTRQSEFYKLLASICQNSFILIEVLSRPNVFG